MSCSGLVAARCGSNLACNGRNVPVWYCDEDAERLRQTFLDADNTVRPAALAAWHEHLAQGQPDIVRGQHQQP